MRSEEEIQKRLTKIGIYRKENNAMVDRGEVDDTAWAWNADDLDFEEHILRWVLNELQ